MGCCASTQRSSGPQQISESTHPESRTTLTVHVAGSSTSPVVAAVGNTGSIGTNSGGVAGLFRRRTDDAETTLPGLGHGQPWNSSLNQPLRQHHQWRAEEELTRAELLKRRSEYFDTRVTGRQEIWNAIRMAIETMDNDLQTAQTILDVAGVTIPSGDLVKGAYDELGNLYPIPEYCVSDPINLASEDVSSEGSDEEDDSAEEKLKRRESKGKSVEGELIRVKARLSDRGGRDVEIWIGKDENVRVLARRLAEHASAETSKVRLALLGKILKENEPLPAQGWTPGMVINAFVF